MHKSWTTRLNLSLVMALCCAASAAQAQDTYLSRLLEYEPAVLEADRAQFDRAQFDGAQTFEDDSVEQASMLLQQPAGQPAAPAADAARRSTRGSRQANVGLASVPNMFGDCGPTTANITILANGMITEAGFMLPVIGGARTAKIAENGNSLPVDRIYFNYNHFNGIFEMQSQSALPPGPTRFRSEPIDRYTIGYEKTFFDQWTSIELRMPFTGSYYATLPGIAVDSGNYGNLAVILKALFYQDDNLGIGFGLGLDTPTGSSTVARTAPANLRFQNQALHILPYAGFLYSPGDPQFGWGDSWFMSGFIQVDAAANGNTVTFEDTVTQDRTDLGKFTEQTVMYYDLALGYWLYRDPDAERITGLSLITELHYITAVQDADLVAGTTTGAGAVITNPLNRFDVLNGTVGIQTLFFDKSSLRVAGVFPFGQQADKRFFDAEVQVQFNRRF